MFKWSSYLIDIYNCHVLEYTLVTMIEPNGKIIEKFIPQIEKAHQRIMRRELEEIAEKRLAGLDFPIPQVCIFLFFLAS